MANQSGGENKDEQFLSAVSAFIRRCFEYAEPDHPSKQNENDVNGAAEQVDLLELDDPGKELQGSLTSTSNTTSRPKR